MKKCPVCKIVAFVGGLGAFNWLLLAAFQIDLVTTLFGGMTLLSKIIYVVIGIAGLILLIGVFKPCPCGKSS